MLACVANLALENESNHVEVFVCLELEGHDLYGSYELDGVTPLVQVLVCCKASQLSLKGLGSFYYN